MHKGEPCFKLWGLISATCPLLLQKPETLTSLKTPFLPSPHPHRHGSVGEETKGPYGSHLEGGATCEEFDHFQVQSWSSKFHLYLCP